MSFLGNQGMHGRGRETNSQLHPTEILFAWVARRPEVNDHADLATLRLFELPNDGVVQSGGRPPVDPAAAVAGSPFAKGEEISFIAVPSAAGWLASYAASLDDLGPFLLENAQSRQCEHLVRAEIAQTAAEQAQRKLGRNHHRPKRIPAPAR